METETKETQSKDIFTRVQVLGEEALQKLADVPGGSKLLDMANQSRGRLDEIQKRLRGLDVLERRVDELEARLVKLEGGTPAKPAATAKKPAEPKTPSSSTETPAA